MSSGMTGAMVAYEFELERYKQLLTIETIESTERDKSLIEFWKSMVNTSEQLIALHRERERLIAENLEQSGVWYE